MNTLDDGEFEARLESIRTGPWQPRGALAHETIGAPDGSLPFDVAPTTLDLRDLVLPPQLAKLQKRLAITLRPHSYKHVPTERAQEIRDSFDEALTQLQLMELAITTGYLPEEQALDVARTELISLLWSLPARQFIDHYAYTGIESLARRAGLGGLRRVEPTEIDPTGTPHFAAFLATQRAIEADPPAQNWLAFLDEYVVRRNEQNEFYAFLQAGGDADSERRLSLVTGAHNFAVMLADFLATTPATLRPRFASFHAYWLAKLFGYQRASRGTAYVRNVEIWGRSPESNWATSVCGWFDARAAASEDDPSMAAMARRVGQATRALRGVWDELRQPTIARSTSLIPDGSRAPSL